MNSEKLITKKRECSVNISGNKVDSFRCKEDMTTVIRVYDGGNIGIAAVYGEDDGTLFDKAKEKLTQAIPYPENLEKDKTRSEESRAEIIPEDAFVDAIKRLIARLTAAYPDFIFSYKVTLNSIETQYENSLNTRYSYAGENMNVLLSIKEKNSVNIGDIFYGASLKSYNEDDIVKDIGALVNTYNVKVPFPKEDVPVTLATYDVIYNFLSEFTAEKYMTGASLFNGKLDKKAFSDKLTIFCDKTVGNTDNIPFFDAEGTVCENDKFYYVKNGVFEGIASNKRTARQFSLPLSGSAYTEFDDVPKTGFAGADVQTNAKFSDIKGKCIYISVTSGGDMSPDGDISLPVLTAYLCEDGKPVGVLPEFAVCGNVFDILGDKLIAVADNDMFKRNEEKLIITTMNIVK